MIIGLIGEVIYKDLLRVHLNVNSVIYEIFISFHTSNAIELNKVLKFNITQIIKEDSHQLYGFLDINEKIIFDRLLKISGVGGRVAIAICSHFTPREFNQILQTTNVNELKKVSGIGEKSAKKILLELGDFELDIDSNTNRLEASLALEALGFKRDLIATLLKDIDTSLDTAIVVKEALKRI